VEHVKGLSDRLDSAEHILGAFYEDSISEPDGPLGGLDGVFWRVHDQMKGPSDNRHPTPPPSSISHLWSRNRPNL
jgi:hypothetical protein